MVCPCNISSPKNVVNWHLEGFHAALTLSDISSCGLSMFKADKVEGLILVVLKTLDEFSLWPVLQSLGDLERIYLWHKCKPDSTLPHFPSLLGPWWISQDQQMNTGKLLGNGAGHQSPLACVSKHEDCASYCCRCYPQQTLALVQLSS